MVNIANYTESNVQIYNYAQKPKMSKNLGIFAFAERLPTSATLVQSLILKWKIKIVQYSFVGDTLL